MSKRQRIDEEEVEMEIVNCNKSKSAAAAAADIYFRFSRTDYPHKVSLSFSALWMVFSGVNGSVSEVPEMSDEDKVPPEVYKCMCYANAVRDGVIYFMGGKDLSVPTAPFRQLFAFNTVSKSWRRLSDMATPRMDHIAVTALNSIFVFGNRGGFKIKDPLQYGEIYSISDDKWEYLPAPPSILYSSAHFIDSHGVCEKNNCLVFLARGWLFQFCLLTKNWLSYVDFESSLGVQSYFNYNPRFIFVDGVMYWHSRGNSILAWDLFNNHDKGEGGNSQSRLCPKKLCQIDLPDGTILSFLLPAGKGRLCLVWSIIHEVFATVGCNYFNIQKDKDFATMLLQPELESPYEQQFSAEKYTYIRLWDAFPV